MTKNQRDTTYNKRWNSQKNPEKTASRNDLLGLIDYLEEGAVENYDQETAGWFNRCAAWVKARI